MEIAEQNVAADFVLNKFRTPWPGQNEDKEKHAEKLKKNLNYLLFKLSFFYSIQIEKFLNFSIFFFGFSKKMVFLFPRLKQFS